MNLPIGIECFTPNWTLLCVRQGGQAAVISHALEKNRELQKRLKAGLASLDRASQRLSELRASVVDIKLRYKGGSA